MHDRRKKTRQRIRFVLPWILALLAFSIAEPAHAANYSATLRGGATLYPGDSLWSPNGLYRLTQQDDGNLVLYSMPGNKPFWASGSAGRRGSITQFQTDGNLVVYAPGHTAVWASATSGRPNSVLVIQDDANVVIRAPGNIPIWATNAQFISGCSDGSRTQAVQYAASGQFYDPVPIVTWTTEPIVGALGNTQSYAIELRYNPQRRCAWALGVGDTLAPIYIDRSSDGGRTWTGRLGNRTPGVGQSTTYTGVYNDSFPYVSRACEISDDGVAHCTAWF